MPGTKPLLRALKGESVYPTPFWYMRQAGRYLPEYQEIRRKKGDFLSLCYSPEDACEVTLQPVRRYGMDAAILFSDILVVPHALGQSLEYREGEGPVLEPVRERKSLERLQEQRGKLDLHLRPVFEAVGKIKGELDKNTTLIGFAGAPWTVATYMIEGRGSREFQEAKRMMREQPEDFIALMQLLTEVTAQYLIAQIEAGAEAVQLFDSWAGALTEEEFLRWSVEPTKAIVQAVHARYPEVPVIGFPKGAGERTATYVRETGVNGIGIDSTITPEWARDHLQPYATVQGNLDPQLLRSDIHAALTQAEYILDVLAGGPFIFNLGHGILPGTPPEHVKKLSDLLKHRKRSTHAAA